MRYHLLLILVLGISSCRPAEKPAAERTETEDKSQPVIREIPAAEKYLQEAGLVDIRSVDPGIFVELKYSGTDNFLGYDMYGDLDNCYLQPDVAEKLAKAAALLREKSPGTFLLVYDGARPRSVQQKMWDTIMKTPAGKGFYVSNPKMGSLHNFGAAVDLTLCNENGQPLDMGTPYDYFGELAHPVKEAYFLQTGQLTHDQVKRRKLLREVMRKAGFSGIESEWWHFNACSRETAQKKYKIIE